MVGEAMTPRKTEDVREVTFRSRDEILPATFYDDSSVSSKSWI